MLQIAEYNEHGVDPAKLDKQKLFSFLQGSYLLPLNLLGATKFPFFFLFNAFFKSLKR